MDEPEYKFEYENITEEPAPAVSNQEKSVSAYRVPPLARAAAPRRPETAYPQQAQPGNPQQAQPGNPQQVQPGNPQSVQPGDPQSVQPGNPQSVQPGNPQQAQPGYPQPAQTGSEGWYGYPNMSAYPYQKPEKGDGVGMGIASLVLGVVSIFLFACCINIVTGILAIIFGIIQIVKNKQKGMAIAGIILASVSIVLGILTWAVVIIGGLGSLAGYGF